MMKGFIITLDIKDEELNNSIAEEIEGTLLELDLKVEIINSGSDIFKEIPEDKIDKIINYFSGLFVRNGIGVILNRKININLKELRGIIVSDNAETKEAEIIISKNDSVDKIVKRTIKTLETLKYIPELSSKEYSEEEASEVEDRLRALGYIE